jgi:hypothetical protein
MRTNSKSCLSIILDSNDYKYVTERHRPELAQREAPFRLDDPYFLFPEFLQHLVVHSQFGSRSTFPGCFDIMLEQQVPGRETEGNHPLAEVAVITVNNRIRVLFHYMAIQFADFIAGDDFTAKLTFHRPCIVHNLPRGKYFVNDRMFIPCGQPALSFLSVTGSPPFNEVKVSASCQTTGLMHICHGAVALHANNENQKRVSIIHSPGLQLSLEWNEIFRCQYLLRLAI